MSDDYPVHIKSSEQFKEGKHYFYIIVNVIFA
jgi:hypothetical protein